MKTETKAQAPKLKKHWHPETDEDVRWVESGVYSNQGNEIDYGSEDYKAAKEFAYGNKRKRDELLKTYPIERLREFIAKYLFPPRRTHK